MSDTHFYMMYNDKALGITVQCTNKATGKSTSRDGFESTDAAHDWLLNNHHRVIDDATKMMNDSPIQAGQRWTGKFNRREIIKVVSVDGDLARISTYSEKNQGQDRFDTQIDINDLADLVKTDCFLMQDNETATECLKRNMSHDV